MAVIQERTSSTHGCIPQGSPFARPHLRVLRAWKTRRVLSLELDVARRTRVEAAEKPFARLKIVWKCDGDTIGSERNVANWYFQLLRRRFFDWSNGIKDRPLGKIRYFRWQLSSSCSPLRGCRGLLLETCRAAGVAGAYRMRCTYASIQPTNQPAWCPRLPARHWQAASLFRDQAAA